MLWVLDLSILLSICVCIYICSADYVELPVLLYQVSTSMFGISHVVQNEVLVLGLLVVVYRIPYSSCM